MVDPTGVVEIAFGGTTYNLRLTMRGISRLQVKHGLTLAGMLDGSAGAIPDMSAVLDLVSEALQKGEGMGASEADDLADEMASADPGIVGRIVSAAFPDPTEGNGKPKRGKAA